MLKSFRLTTDDDAIFLKELLKHRLRGWRCEYETVSLPLYRVSSGFQGFHGFNESQLIHSGFTGYMWLNLGFKRPHMISRVKMGYKRFDGVKCGFKK